jgi:hypothetical protein
MISLPRARKKLSPLECHSLFRNEQNRSNHVDRRHCCRRLVLAVRVVEQTITVTLVEHHGLKLCKSLD